MKCSFTIIMPSAVSTSFGFSLFTACVEMTSPKPLAKPSCAAVLPSTSVTWLMPWLYCAPVDSPMVKTRRLFQATPFH